MLRGIPERISRKIESFSTPSIAVACVQNLTEKKIRETKLNLIDFKIDGEVLSIDQNELFPNEKFGSVSKENIHGKEITHKDRPKVDKDIYFGERPNYGDWSNGSFSLWQRRLVYQKSFIQPRGYSLQIEIHEYNKLQKTWKVTFKVNTDMAINSASFEDDLLFALSLLNEVARKNDVFTSDVTPEQIATAKHVSWEIFPRGKRDIKTLITKRLFNYTPEYTKNIIDRASVIDELKPQQFIFGTEITNDYYGAQFHKNLIIFENVKYGNATYILYENWEELSKLSRTEILNSQNNFDRIIHDSNWEKKLRDTLQYKLGKLNGNRFF